MEASLVELNCPSLIGEWVVDFWQLQTSCQLPGEPICVGSYEQTCLQHEEYSETLLCTLAVEDGTQYSAVVMIHCSSRLFCNACNFFRVYKARHVRLSLLPVHIQPEISEYSLSVFL